LGKFEISPRARMTKVTIIRLWKDTTMNYERIVTVWNDNCCYWVNLATVDNPWNPNSEISWPACVGALEVSGIV
jgi:hypothetical protein